ncbi:hypothetical protein GGI07_002527 [Coemansia sp. Benny D115]|nr:hypothetical protein GGI07_002527 [Coemansia sp. Benny D115]
MAGSFEARYTSGDAATQDNNGAKAVTRRASLLTRNRAFDGYKISDRSSRASRRSYMMPEITLRRVFFVGLWVLIQAIILVYKWVDVAKSSKKTLTGFMQASISCMMFSFSAIFIFMSPTLLELLRRTFISRYVSIEKNVHAHKIAGYSFLFWALAHVISYYYKFANVAAQSNGKKTLSSMLFGTMVGKTGHALLFLMVILFATAAPWVRRRFHEVFYWMHHLFVPLTALIFVHGSNSTFRWYIVGPGCIYAVDRLYRFCRSRFRKPRILSVIQHPSNVIELKIERRGMHFEVGQFVYINIPSISLLEWHPFTLTSAPEEDVLSLHIWIAGDWTRRLVQTFQACGMRNLQGSSNLDGPAGNQLGAMYMHDDKFADSKVSGLTDKLVSARRVPSNPGNMATLQALADQELLMQHLRSGPGAAELERPGTAAHHGQRRPGTAASHQKPWAHGGRGSVVLMDRLPPEVDFRNSDGFTHTDLTMPPSDQPLISLPTLLIDGPYGAPTQQVFDYEHIVLVGGGIGVTPMSSVLKSLYYQLTEMTRQRHIKKVYFLWVCRDIQALEWFQDLLLALDEEDIGDILEIRTYLTGQLTVDQIRNIALYQDPSGPDAVTGMLRSPTYYGRPNFDTIFENIGMRTPGADIGVFFCGPKPMGNTLRRISRKWTKKLSYTGTAFRFHKENF